MRVTGACRSDRRLRGGAREVPILTEIMGMPAGTPGPVWDLLLYQVYALCAQDQTEIAVKLTFTTINGLLCGGHFDECDRLLDKVDTGRLNSHLLVAFLTITAAARDRLQARQRLAPRVRSALVRLKGEEYTQRLLKKIP